MKRRRALLYSLFNRETDTLSAKRFRTAIYTALVPSSTFINVSGIPNVLLRRFTPCGKYLICLSRNHRDLILFRFESGGRRANAPRDVDFATPAFSSNPHPRQDSLSTSPTADPFGGSGILGHINIPLANPIPEPAPPRLTHNCNFSRFFTKRYSHSIATGSETLLEDFCLATPQSTYLILASCQERDGEPEQNPNPRPALSECPVLDRFTLHLVQVSTGNVCDRFCLTDDYVALEGHSGVHMLGDMLLVLSARQQILHIIKVQEGIGRFAEEATIGANCSPDDDLEISRVREAELSYQRKRGGASEENGLPDDGNESGGSGLGNGKLQNGFYTGLMQRLLAYLYRRLCSEGKRRLFYRVMEQYSMLIMQKAQFLDRDHLLIRLGSYERQSKHDNGMSTCFFVVYCISSTRIINLYENRSVELLCIYERFRDLFVGDAAVAATLPSGRPIAPEVSGRDEQRMSNPILSELNGRARNRGRRIRAALSVLPICAQSHNVSPYLDRSLFSYNVDRLAALDGSRALPMREVNSVKFTSAETGAMRFKLSAGIPFGMNVMEPNMREGGRKKMLFLFHPHLPFVISMEYGGGGGVSNMTPSLLNFHVYGHFAVEER